MWLPFPSNKTIESIINELSKNKSLTAKRLHNILSARGINISYQAVFKNLAHLSEKGVISKVGREYKISDDWSRKTIRFFSELLERRIILERKGKSPITYHFGDADLMIKDVPSVVISKSTLKMVINLMNKYQLGRLASDIARKDLLYVQGNAVSGSNKKDPLLILEKVGVLARGYYWGDVDVERLGEGIRLRVTSKTYTADKEMRFYKSIYVEIMRLLGYRLGNEDILSGWMTFGASYDRKS